VGTMQVIIKKGAEKLVSVLHIDLKNHPPGSSIKCSHFSPFCIYSSVNKGVHRMMYGASSGERFFVCAAMPGCLQVRRAYG